MTRSVGFALATLLLIPLIIICRWIMPIWKHPFKILFGFLTLYRDPGTAVLLGRVRIDRGVLEYALSIQTTVFLGHVGAGLGSIVADPLMASISPSGLMLLASASGLLAATLFAGRRARGTGSWQVRLSSL